MRQHQTHLSSSRRMLIGASFLHTWNIAKSSYHEATLLKAIVQALNKNYRKSHKFHHNGVASWMVCGGPWDPLQFQRANPSNESFLNFDPINFYFKVKTGKFNGKFGPPLKTDHGGVLHVIFKFVLKSCFLICNWFEYLGDTGFCCLEMCGLDGKKIRSHISRWGFLFVFFSHPKSPSDKLMLIWRRKDGSITPPWNATFTQVEFRFPRHHKHTLQRITINSG